MKKILVLGLFILSITQTIKSILPKRPWLFYTHIAAVNNLYDFANLDIKEMQKGANNKVNTLVLLNGYKYYGRFTQRITIGSSGNIVRENISPLDSGTTNTLISGVKWAISQAPHDYLVIDLWDHGSGILNPSMRSKRGVCFDDFSLNYLDDLNLRSAFKEIVNFRDGKKIDIIGFDACLMASLENSATIAEYANYIVSSEETIPGLGWGYNTVLNSLNKSTLPRDFAINMVESYKNTYTNVEADFTMSAVDTKNIMLLAQNFNNTAKLLVDILRQDSSFSNLIKKSLNNTVSYFEPHYVDLGNLFQNIIANLNKTKLKVSKKLKNNLVSKLEDCIQLIEKCVIHNVAGSSKKGSTGLSIYFPTGKIDSSYSKLYWTQQFPNWLTFLKEYLS